MSIKGWIKGKVDEYRATEKGKELERKALEASIIAQVKTVSYVRNDFLPAYEEAMKSVELAAEQAGLAKTLVKAQAAVAVDYLKNRFKRD